jgi:hypothetical protein
VADQRQVAQGELVQEVEVVVEQVVQVGELVGPGRAAVAGVGRREDAVRGGQPRDPSSRRPKVPCR